jgi:putative Holliday junction resolvase
LVDERLTSISAKKALVEQGIKTGHNKGLIDQTAAAIILQQYLDSQQ